jgi:DNA repair protein RecO (recombination protein O)
MSAEDPRSLLQPAFVLHRRPYSNTSLLLEAFVLDAGRLPLLAKGATAGRAFGASLLQPFVPLLVSRSGRGEVRTLGRYEAEGPPVPLTGERLYCGFYVNELMVHLLPREEPHPALFGAYAATLARLARDDDPEPALRCFEVALLAELGYALLLDREAEGGAPIDAAARYDFVIERGPVPVAGGELSGATLLKLASGSAPVGDERREARRLLRRVLDHYLGGRPLKSRELFVRA